MWSLKGIVVYVIAPEESIRPSITSTRIERVILLLGMLCVCANLMSIKHDVAPESSKAFVFRVIEPHWRVIGSVKLVVEEVGWLGPSHNCRLLWSRCTTPTATGDWIFPAGKERQPHLHDVVFDGVLFLGKSGSNGRGCHNRDINCWPVDIVVAH